MCVNRMLNLLIVLSTICLKEHSYSTTPSEMKKRLLQKEGQLQSVKQELRNSKKREAHAKKKCGDLVKELDKLNLVNEELKVQLEAYGGNTV